MSESSAGCSCGGCLTAIVVGFVLFAMICGITYGGKHYAIQDCSCDQGVVVH